LTQVGGVLLYGSADEEIPFLRHGATNPPLAHREFDRLGAEIEEERGTRVTRGYAYAPWRRLCVRLRQRRRRAGTCCGGGANSEGARVAVGEECRIGFWGGTYIDRRSSGFPARAVSLWAGPHSGLYLVRKKVSARST
jgi:hypothetical protein